MTKFNIEQEDLIATEKFAQFLDADRIVHFEHAPMEETGYSAEGIMLVTFDEDGNATGEITDCRYWHNCEPVDWNYVDQDYIDELVEAVLVKCKY